MVYMGNMWKKTAPVNHGESLINKNTWVNQKKMQVMIVQKKMLVMIPFQKKQQTTGLVSAHPRKVDVFSVRGHNVGEFQIKNVKHFHEKPIGLSGICWGPEVITHPRAEVMRLMEIMRCQSPNMPPFWGLLNSMVIIIYSKLIIIYSK